MTLPGFMLVCKYKIISPSATRSCLPFLCYDNVQPRPQSLLRFQDGGWVGRRPWRRAGHMSPKILEILIVSKWRWARNWLILWSRDLLFARIFFARVFFAPTRHLEAEMALGTRLRQCHKCSSMYKTPLDSERSLYVLRSLPCHIIMGVDCIKINIFY